MTEAALRELRADLHGEVLTPRDPGYDAARKVFNAMIDRRPAAIALCTSTAHVVHCVQFARTHGLTISVRGGEHSVAGEAVCDGALMVDLSRMKHVRVDATERTARAEPGLTLGEFDAATQAVGLATTMGIVSNTGIAGLTLGGGIGWLNGQYGLTCDNLRSAELVLADGRVLTADPSAHADLFWAVRGGGGNFGIVTAFEYQLHSVGPVLAGMVIHPLEKAKAALRFYHAFASECPDELSTAAVLLTSPDGNPALALAACHTRSLDSGERALKPLRSFSAPLADLIAPMGYAQCQRMVDAAFPPGQRHYWKSSFLRDLTDEAIDVLLRFAATKPSPHSAIGLQQMHGAAARVGSSETAFPHRQNQYDFLGLSIWSDPADDEKNIRWARDLFDAMQPYLDRSVYVNDLGEEGDARVRAAYGPNYDRLVALKNTYDSTNFFRLNQNIAPTTRNYR
jgi:FAD/FMN-containing dehydrogenase